MTQKRIARVIARLAARTTETLAWRAAQQHVEFAGIQSDSLKHGISGEFANVRRLARRSGKIAPVGFHGVGVKVSGKPNVVARLTEAERTSARASKQADGRRLGVWVLVGEGFHRVRVSTLLR